MAHAADSFDGTHHHTRHVKAPFLLTGTLTRSNRPAKPLIAAAYSIVTTYPRACKT
ncbi:hypothetical protein D805_1639 [Bifidobacterium thermophilum RBL67]|uniref:Uncharacterized protein n=1 Tax=Bifidobacterium thermophilum RBL67 TaxID=1254439 RepID=M4REE4_9BIFI|nr:hypothetical protein D805_1639 [Bifidobacterium thermophilum RBL67]